MSTTTTASPNEAKLWGGGKSPFNSEYGKVMMWYFLMSDAFTFGAFLISYGTVRFSTNGWPDPNLVFKSFPFAPEGVKFLSFSLFMGIAMSITAFPVLARIVQERGIHKTKLGTIVITCAAADDITAWCILAAVIAIVKAGSVLSAIYIILLAIA